MTRGRCGVFLPYNWLISYVKLNWQDVMWSLNIISWLFLSHNFHFIELLIKTNCFWEKYILTKSVLQKVYFARLHISFARPWRPSNFWNRVILWQTWIRGSFGNPFSRQDILRIHSFYVFFSFPLFIGELSAISNDQKALTNKEKTAPFKRTRRG